MAHLAKYKVGAVAPMLHHYNRDLAGTLSRENIDSSRTNLNYRIGVVHLEDGSPVMRHVENSIHWQDIKNKMDEVEKSTGKRIRKDAVIMADLVITAPEDLKTEDYDKFFKSCYSYMGRIVGEENVLPGYVHMDERTPHMHLPFLPIKDGKFNFNGLIDRNVYRNLHKGLSKKIDKTLGYHVSIELDPKEQAKKELSKLKQGEYVQAVEELERVKLEKAQEKASLNEIKQAIPDERAKLEGLQNENAKLSAQAAALDGQISENSTELSKLKDDIKTETDRLESVRQAGDRADVRIEFLESIVGALREFQNARRGERGQILAQIRDAIGKFLARFRPADERVSSEVLQQQRVEEPATEPQRSVQEPVKAQRGLSALASEKQDLSKALSRASAAEVMASAREHHKSSSNLPRRGISHDR